MRNRLLFLPKAVSFSAIERGGEDCEEPVEFGAEDQRLLDAYKDEHLLFVLKTLSKDRYRVIALLLFLRELGYEYRYEDIASIWGQGKVAVFNTIQRMKRKLESAGVTPQTPVQRASRTTKPSLDDWRFSAVWRLPRGKLGLKGVTRRGSRYEASITVAGKRIYLGRFATPEEAGRAYDQAAREHFGSLAYTNFR